MAGPVVSLWRAMLAEQLCCQGRSSISPEHLFPTWHLGGASRPGWASVHYGGGLSSYYCSARKPGTEKAMAPYSSTLAWKILWTEEPRRLQSMGSLRVRHD